MVKLVTLKPAACRLLSRAVPLMAAKADALIVATWAVDAAATATATVTLPDWCSRRPVLGLAEKEATVTDKGKTPRTDESAFTKACCDALNASMVTPISVTEKLTA